jgi:hypothetical protein
MDRTIQLTLELTEYEAALLLERTVATAGRPAHAAERKHWLNMARQMADRLMEVTTGTRVTHG